MKKIDISSAGLHILAMALMFIDHLGVLIFPGNVVLRSIGRLAFPIFAFLLAEGYRHTRNSGGYLLRLMAGAAVAEIPYNLMVSGDMSCPYHQNVLLTFALGLLLMMAVDKLRLRRVIPLLLAGFIGYAAGELCMVDYGCAGVLTVYAFYLFSDRPVMLLLSQVGLHRFLIGSRTLAFGGGFAMPMQVFAVLALIPIWLYRGRQGHHSKWFRALCYGFYPAHMFALWLVRVAALNA